MEKVFADGFIFKRGEKAPDFVVGNLSIKTEDATAFLRKHDKNGWVNLQIKTSKEGKHYMELDTFEPKQQGQPQAPTQKEEVNDLPF
jgi:hypothetical protein